MRTALSLGARGLAWAAAIEVALFAYIVVAGYIVAYVSDLTGGG